MSSGTPQDPSIVLSQRRYWLFRADFEDAALCAGAPELQPRWMYPQGVPDQPVALSDYTDYDNPRSPNYWRNRLPLDGTWAQTYKQTFMQFAATVFQQLNAGTLGLLDTEITPYVRNIQTYDVKASEFSNVLTITFGRPDNLGAPWPDFTQDRLKLSSVFMLYKYLPRKDDIVMVTVTYPGQPSELEYMGFVTANTYGSDYGDPDSFTVGIEGISKMLKTSNIIRQRSIDNNQFLPTVEINDYTDVSVFEDNFNSLTIAQMVQNLLSQAFSYEPTLSPQGPVPASGFQQSYTMDSTAFVAAVTGTAPNQSVQITDGGFQFNFFALLTLFLMTITEAEDSTAFPQRTWGTQQSAPYYQGIILARAAVGGSTVNIPANHANTYLSPLNRAVLEHGSEQVFNTMVANGFELFYSHMAKPDELFGSIRDNDFFDIFESRTGTIVCRPGRYNKIEGIGITTDPLSNTATVTMNADTDPTTGATGIPTAHTIGNIFLQSGTSWEFNPNANFYIHDYDLLDDPGVSFDDSLLESHVDVKLAFTLYGDTPFPAAGYTDPDVLFSSGLRTLGPLTNANALNADAPKIFAPLALAMSNAASRPLNIIVRDNRRYDVGKLYYLETLDCVAYLSDDNIGPNYGDTGSRNLSFTMVRKCVRRPLAEIMAADSSCTYWEALNLALCYTTDPPDSENTTVAQAATLYGVSSTQAIGTPQSMLDVYTAKGIALAQLLQTSLVPGAVAPPDSVVASSGTAGPQVVMFRYIPSILDVALEVEAQPHLANTGTNPQGSPAALATKVESDNRNIAPILNGALGMTYGFQQPPNQQFYEKIMPAVLAVSDAVNAGGGVVPDEYAGVIPAGIIHYGTDPTETGPTAWQEALPSQGVVIKQTQTPFGSDAVNAVAIQAQISQLLVNKLASVDLALKFGGPPIAGIHSTQASLALTPNTGGIPQYYVSNDGGFALFTAGADAANPTDYFAGLGYNSNQMADFLASPQVLAMPILTTAAFQSFLSLAGNGYFIPSVGTGVFNLPYGHFVIVNADGSVTFIAARNKNNPLLGGQFSVTSGGIANSVTIAAVNPSQCELFYDNADAVAASTATFSVPGGTLYFMTPYAEATVERLFDIPLPIEWGGQITQAQLNAQKQSTIANNGQALSANNLRVSGDALNVSPDYLAASSGSDLQTVAPRPANTAIGAVSADSVYKRFEAAFFAAPAPISGFQTPGQSAVAFSDAITVAVSYPSGLSGGQRECLVYALQIAGPANAVTGMQQEDSNYAAALLVAAPSTEIQPAVPGGATASSIQNTAQT